MPLRAASRMPSARSTSRDAAPRPSRRGRHRTFDSRLAGRRAASACASGARNIISPGPTATAPVSLAGPRIRRAVVAQCGFQRLQVAHDQRLPRARRLRRRMPRACARQLIAEAAAQACQRVAGGRLRQRQLPRSRVTEPVRYRAPAPQQVQIELPEIHRGSCGEPPATRGWPGKGQADYSAFQFAAFQESIGEWLGGSLDSLLPPLQAPAECTLGSLFPPRIESLKLAQARSFHGEGILAVTKALLQSGVTYAGGYQGRGVHLLDVMVRRGPTSTSWACMSRPARTSRRRRRCWPRRWSTRAAAR